MRGPENMASDSEPKNFFFEAPRGPLRSHISESKTPVTHLQSSYNQPTWLPTQFYLCSVYR